MPNIWESPAWVKIHEGCGGRVRWVEAVDTPGVGYTGECLWCGSEEVAREGIIPVRVRGIKPGFGGRFDIRQDVVEAPLDLLEDLEWDGDASHDENQLRLRAEILDASGRASA